MSGARHIEAVLDACVLYPAPLRDFLLSLADAELYKPLWSEEIQNEWIRNLLKNRADLSEIRLRRTVRFMNDAFPDAEIHGFREITRSLSLPDKDDNHVLAAGIRSNADVIITFNLTDFPKRYVSQYDIQAQHPDIFIWNLIDLDAGEVINAFQNQVARLKNPVRTENQVLDTLASNGIKRSVNKIRVLTGR